MARAQLHLLLTVLLLLLIGCAAEDLDAINTLPANTAPASNAPETTPSTNNAPTNTAPASNAPETTPSTNNAPANNSPSTPNPVDNTLMLGWTFHHEGWNWENETVYNRYLELHDAMIESFNAGGGVMTSEVRNEYVRTIRARNSTLLTDLEAENHAVGVHADLGGNPRAPGFNQEVFVRRLTTFREMLEATSVQVSHVSGVCSHLNWVKAVQEAGYHAVTGNVAYCLSSLPRTQRPDPYKDCENAGACHQVWPEGIEDRIVPWRMKDGLNWTEHDPTGEVIMIPTSGALPCFAEAEANPDESHTRCTAARDDVDAFIRDLQAAIVARSPNTVHTYYLVWSMGQSPEIELMEYFFERVQALIATGTVKWATIPEMIAAYNASE